MTALVSLLFIAMISIDLKLQNFPYTCIISVLGEFVGIEQSKASVLVYPGQSQLALKLTKTYLHMYRQ